MKIYKFLLKPMRKTAAFFQKAPVLFCVVWAFLINLTIEALSRHSLFDGLSHIVNSKGAFFCNALVVFAISLVCLFFRRRLFALVLSSVGVLALGVINCAILFYRSTPLSAIDFVKIGANFGILGLYLKKYLIVFWILVIVLVITALVLLFRFSKKHKREWLQGVIILPITALFIALLTQFCLSKGILSKRFTNLPDAYRDYGFLYCFSCSVFDTGISRPVDYSPEKVNTILDEIRFEENLVPQDTPNIIFLQLESFFDVNKINVMEFSEDPIPFFNSLKKSCPHAYLTVPCIGAGTANVEFEVITGMTVDFFGPGEYPYKTVLQNSSCESIPYNLAKFGYKSHAIHNHKANFYDRAHVFSSLGFDTFTSLEFMQDVEYNPIGWACDSVLTSQILKALDSTDEHDFVYTIGVQPHGIYPETPIEGFEAPIDVVMKTKNTKISEVSMEYYVSQLREVDKFLEELVSALELREEKTVLVVYGDHLPYLKIQPEELLNGDIYQTEYVVWSNYDLPVPFYATNLYSYELSANIMKRLGINNGLITKLHQNCSEHPDYMKYLEMLQYDMLYGQKECYGYEIVYEPSEIVLGVAPITVEDVKNREDGIEIKGTEFTPFSRVYINGTKLATEFVDNSTLFVKGHEVLYGDSVVVHQTNGERTSFSESEPFIADLDVNPFPYENFDGDKIFQK